MKIGIKTMMWKRPEVFEVYAAGIKRLRDRFGVIPFVVGSEGDVSRKICENHGFIYLEHPNKPLGSKANACLRSMRGRVDYVLNLGSDDLISDSLMELYIKLIKEDYDFIGLKDLYIYERIQKKLIYFQGYTGPRQGESIGLGRMVSTKLLDEFNWELWADEKNSSLDLSMTKKLKSVKTKIISLKESGTFAVDIKDNDNIWRFSIFKNYPQADLSLMNNLPEYTMLK